MEGEYLSVEDLIKKLLKCDMDWEIKIKDKQGYKIPEASIVAIKPEGIVCLFG